MSRHHLSGLVVTLSLALSACSDPTRTVASIPDEPSLARAAADPVVSSVVPDAIPRGTTLNVTVNGSGFDKGASVKVMLGGVTDPRVRVNSTKYVKSTQLVANVTADADAVADLYDVVVVTTSGKTGIGTESLEIVLQGEVLEGGLHALGINASDVAVGRGPSDPGCSTTTAHLWHADGSRAALPLGANCGGEAKAINGSGRILGVVFPTTGPSDGALWTIADGAYSLEPFPRTADGYRPITDAMNDAGDMLGWGQRGAEVFWWSASTGWLSVQVPAGATACQTFDGLNNRGELAGTCTINGVRQAYYWLDHSSAPVALPTPAGVVDAVPRDINDVGVIVGYGSGKALRWVPSPTGYVAEVLGDDGYGAAAYAVADDGTVVGSVKRSGSGAGSVPAYWPAATTESQRLEVPRGASGGEALDVVTVSGRVVIVGTCADIAVRWRADPALF